MKRHGIVLVLSVHIWKGEELQHQVFTQWVAPLMVSDQEVPLSVVIPAGTKFAPDCLFTSVANSYKTPDVFTCQRWWRLSAAMQQLTKRPA